MTTLLDRPDVADRPAPLPPATEAPPPTEKPARLVSLDAYRGFIMLFMASAGFAIPAVAKTVAETWPDRPLLIGFWEFLAFHTDHVAWVGGGLWDMIQPAFMFMVGVAIPYSYAARKAKGDSERCIWMHTWWRAFLLVMLAVLLSSGGSKMTVWVFVNVLAQIGLGYPFVYALRGRGLRWQVAAVLTILVGNWLCFALFPLPEHGFTGKEVGWLLDPKHPYSSLGGFFAHWDKNANYAHAFDLWFLNLFPTAKPFRYNPGGYATLNFIPSMATMLFGLMTGEMLRRKIDVRRKLHILLGAGVGCVLVGLILGWTVCPIVKRIWTPSWAVYSTGWVLLMLAGFYWAIDVKGYKRWAFPLVVVGVNSIAMYCMSQLIKGWVHNTLDAYVRSFVAAVNGGLHHLGMTVTLAGPFDGVFGPILLYAATLAVLWLFCWWMYRRGLFLKI